MNEKNKCNNQHFIFIDKIDINNLFTLYAIYLSWIILAFILIFYLIIITTDVIFNTTYFSMLSTGYILLISFSYGIIFSTLLILIKPPIKKQRINCSCNVCKGVI